MAIIQGNAKQGSTRGFYPKVINGSLRFNDNDSAYLSWTPDATHAAGRATYTFSCWFKISGGFGSNTRPLFGAGSTTWDMLYISSGDVIAFSQATETISNFRSNAKLRDPSAWYHIVLTVDTTQATDTDRVKCWLNGELVTWSTSTYPTPQNETSMIADNVAHYIGKHPNSTAYWDGYFGDMFFISGTALTADDFGETKNGVWVAKDYAGTFGTNGFYLTFEDDTAVEAFNTVLYRGTGTATGTKNPVTGMGFSPDLLWIKNRDAASDHALYDKVRGVGVSDMSRLESNNTDAEVIAYGALQSIDSDGFTIGPSGQLNASGNNYVAWGWKAGDSNVSNTNGTITSTVRANDTYGFSIVSWTGNGTAGATIGHGLGAVPSWIIVKNRGTSGTENRAWTIYHSALGATKYIEFSTSAADTATNRWNDTAPTSSVFTVGDGSNGNENGDSHIAYCWAEKSGYSKFGSYTGNGSSTGPTVTVGFQIAWVIIKKTDGAGVDGWFIIDNTRDTDNVANKRLAANSSDAEGTDLQLATFSSTGFQITYNGQAVNQSGTTYIYAAFADTREAAFWLDQSGNDNDWQPVNLDHNDTVADSPTNNFCTLNPLDNYYLGATFSDGNLRVATNNYTFTTTTMGMTSGKYYAEVLFESNAAAQMLCGITRVPSTGTSDYLGNSNGHISYYNINGNKYVNGGASTAYGATYTVGDVIGIAVDMDAGEITFFKNGTSQGVITGAIDTSATYFFAGGDFSGANNNTMVWNFGQQPFKYDPPA